MWACGVLLFCIFALRLRLLFLYIRLLKPRNSHISASIQQSAVVPLFCLCRLRLPRTLIHFHTVSKINKWCSSPRFPIRQNMTIRQRNERATAVFSTHCFNLGVKLLPLTLPFLLGVFLLLLPRQVLSLAILVSLHIAVVVHFKHVNREP